MQTLPKKFLYFAGVILCSYLIAKVLYNSYHRDNIFAIFIYIGLGLAWLFCFYHIIKNDRRNKYWKSIVSIATLIPIPFILAFYQKKLNVPTLIQAQNHGVYAYFKTNGTYFIKSGSWGSKVHLYGNYSLQDSTITIDTSRIDDVLISNRFVIKQANPLETKKYLVQIDQSGKEINARYISKDTLVPFKFEIVIDNMK